VIAYVSQKSAKPARRCSHSPIQREATQEKMFVRGLLEILTKMADRKKLSARTERVIRSVNRAVEFVMAYTRTAVKKSR
jgi:hypothetical protein